MSDPNDDESEEEEEDGGVSREVLEAAGRWAAMSAAVAISGGATSDFNREGGFPRQDLIISRAETSEAALNDLLTRCASVAPSLVAEPVAVLPNGPAGLRRGRRARSHCRCFFLLTTTQPLYTVQCICEHIRCLYF